MNRNRSSLIDALLLSDEPSISWKTIVRVVSEDSDSTKLRSLQDEIRKSPRARSLISARDAKVLKEKHVYGNWRGAHWTLVMLAEIGYPPADQSLSAMRDRVVDLWLNRSFYMEFESKSGVPKHRSAEGVPIIQGRYRRCAVQQGNAPYSVTRLGPCSPLAGSAYDWRRVRTPVPRYAPVSPDANYDRCSPLLNASLVTPGPGP